MSILKSSIINWDVFKPRRAGIIIYDDENYYLGIDRASNDITDFGGKVIYPYENAIIGAIREFKEETLTCFPEVEFVDLFNSKVIISNDFVIFLLKIDYNVDEYINKFNEQRTIFKHSEMIEIIKINREKPVYQNIIYSLIKNEIEMLFVNGI